MLLHTFSVLLKALFVVIYITCMIQQDPVCFSAQQENRPAATYGTDTRSSNAEVLDFSSSSEDEHPCGSRSKAKYPNAGEEFGLCTGSAGSMNLSTLLMKHMTSGMERTLESSEDSQSDTDAKGLNLEVEKVAKRKTGCFLSSDSEEEKNEAPAKSSYGSPTMKGYDNVCMEDMEHRPDWAGQRYNEKVESFDSSEDEAPVRRVKFKKSLRHPFSAQNSAQKFIQFTDFKCAAMHSRKRQIIEETRTGTLDTLLGTVFFIKVSVNCSD